MKNKSTKATLFEFYAPSANQVGLAGTFNGWDPSKNFLKKNNAGNWSISMFLEPGRYEYRFFADGNWENDQRPAVACVPNAFGTWNCVIEVR